MFAVMSADYRVVVKKLGILHPQLAAVVAAMGHNDLLVVADAGLPIPAGVTRIDLAVTAGLPRFLPVVDALAAELAVERLIVADELRTGNAELAADIVARFPSAAQDSVPHERFKALTADAVAVVRTGETTPYANVILSGGVTF